MAATLPGRANSSAVVANGLMGLIAREASTQLSSDGVRAVGIDGEAQFDDPGLAREASQHGLAHAVLGAYQRSGAEVLRFLKGSFSLIVLDAQRRKAFAAVDRMGIRSLYHTNTAQGLVFGTTAAALIAHPWVAVRLDPQAILDYVFLHVVPAPRSIYAGVSKLSLAHSLHYADGKIQIDNYWVPHFIADGTADSKALQAELRDTLQKAVERAMSGKAIGSFLSGGLDSSTVTGFAARNRDPKLAHAYTIGFQQPGYDESAYAKIAAEHFSADLRLYYLQPADVAATINEIAAAYDEPFGNSSAVPALICARNAARDGVEAMLAGDGGDELFAGNERYAKQKIFDYYFAVPAWLRASLLEPLAYGLGRNTQLRPLWKLYRYIDQAKQPARQRLVDVFSQLKGMSAEFIFEPEFLRQLDTQRPAQELMETFDAAPASANLDRMLHLDWKITLADNDLRKVNRMCELAGVQVRYPMLDQQVVELSTRVPASMKLHGLKLRDFYKKAFAQFLPEQIIHKRKHGFGLPFGEWLKTEPVLHDMTHSALASLKARGIFRAACIDQLIASHREGHAAYFGSMVWALVMLELWLQQHNAPWSKTATTKFESPESGVPPERGRS